MRNENDRFLFGKDKNQGYLNSWESSSSISEKLILETYIKVYIKEPKKQTELLSSLSEGKLQVNDQNVICEEIEKIINNDIPSFDKGMYTGVKVQFDANNHFTLKLVEQGGKEVDFNHTSTGRRWYFTYYFIKKCLKPGDVLIVDEPAAFLHPQAQGAILKELEALSSKGCKVIISTHSPYMISDNIQEYFYVKMTDTGTHISRETLKDNSEIKAELGLIGFNSLILGKEKKYILVEGLCDVSVIKKFMQLLNVNSEQYEVFKLYGAPKTSVIYNFIKTTDISYKLMLDADVKSKYKDQIEKIDSSKIVFVGENTKELSIEGLFSPKDKLKYFKSISTKSREQRKVNPMLIEKAKSLSDFEESTVAELKKLFQKLSILS